MRFQSRFPRVSSHRARQIGESLGASVGVQIALFASGIIQARSLGPAGRGDLAILLLLPSVALQLACLGLPGASTYYVARNKAAVRLIARRLLPMAGLQTLVTAALLLGLVLFFLGGKEDASRTAGLLTLVGVPVYVFQYYGIHILQGLGDIRWYNAFRVAIPAVFSIGLVGGLFFGLTVMSCTVIWLVGLGLVTIAMAIVLIARVRRAERGQVDEDKLPTATEMARFGLAGFLAQVSPVETFRIDTLVVASLFPSQVVGYYAVALSLSNAPRFVADGIVAVAYPHVSEQEPAAGLASTRRYMLAAALGCGGITVALAAASPFLIPLLFGQSFAPAAALSSILVVAAALVSIRRVGTDCLRGLGRPGATTAIEAVTLLLLAAGFVLLGPWREGMGVALTLTASALVGLLLTLRSLRIGRPVRADQLASVE